MAELVSIMLEQYGAVCEIAYDMKGAWEKLAKSTFHVITLDILLQEGSGVSFLQELRSKEATKDIPVVVLSAAANDAR
ncbi:MAG: response regulator, partial [Rhodospirillaceae bacterium]|nr:response regulator [Rhodospirillaceae bacterium]